MERAYALNQKFEGIFKAANRFCVALHIDEAHTFMKRCIAPHWAYNHLVTVFLRKFGYYKSVLFLTTSRATDIG